MRTILVTGGAGYIGSHTVIKLLKQDYDVVIFDNLENSDTKRLAAIWKISGKKPDFFQGDLRNPADIQQCFQEKTEIDAVIHFAAYKAVGESQEKAVRYYENNVGGTTHLLQAMEDADVKKLVFSSTCALYGTLEDVPVREDAPLRPKSVYAKTKLMCEEMIQEACRWLGLRAVCLRYFNTVGADDSGEIGEYMRDAQSLVPRVFKVVLGQWQQMEVFGIDYDTPDGTCIRDYIHVNDLAISHLRALSWLDDQKEGIWEAFNLGTGKGYSVLEIIKEIGRVVNKDIPYIVGPRRSGDPEKVFGDIRKASTILGFHPQYDLEDIIKTSWRWYRQAGL